MIIDNRLSFLSDINAYMSNGWKMELCVDFEYDKNKLKLIVLRKEMEVQN